MPKESVTRNFAWKLAERTASQGVSFIVSIVLARILLPEEFGIIAMIQIFIVFAQCFVASGLSSSLIQKKDADNVDFSTILYCGLGLSALLYIIIFFSSPYIAAFYNEPRLTEITQIYALSLLVYAYSSVQHAWVARHMKFRMLFFSTLSGNIISGILGIFLAFQGFGVWALVFQVITSQIVNTIVLTYVTKWTPILSFSVERAIPLLKYGVNILGSSLLSTFYFQLRQMLIGKYYTSSDLAYYNRGTQIPEVISSNIDGSLGQVLFPVMSNYSDSPAKLKELTRKALQITSFLLSFMMGTLIIIADPLVRILLTDKWADCIPFLQIICVAKVLQTISNANIQSFKAAGRSDVVLKLEIIKKPVGFLLIAISFPISVYAVALTVPLYGLYSSIVNASSNKKVLGYSLKEQLLDLRPAFFLSISMIILFLPLMLIDGNNAIKLVLGIVGCTVYYFGIARYYKIIPYLYLNEKMIQVWNKIKDKNK